MCGSLHSNEKAAVARDRAKLAAAIERLEKRQWCEDAQIALEAARKHLATLPPDHKDVQVWHLEYARKGEGATWNACVHVFRSKDAAVAGMMAWSSVDFIAHMSITGPHWQRLPA